MKRILIIVSVVVTGFGCTKITGPTPPSSTDGSSRIKFSILNPSGLPKYPKISYSPNGNAQEFLSFNTNGIAAKFEAPVVAPTDIYLEYKVDAAALAASNARDLAANPSAKPFFLFPDSTFKLLVTKDTIRKGQQYAEKTLNNIVVYTTKIDPSINYMLPITVTSSAYSSAPGTGTIYFYIIGNPLAGTYTVTGGRYNATPTGDQGWAPPAAYPGIFSLVAIPSPKSLQPLSDTTVTVYIANLGAGTSRDYFLGYNPARSTTDISFNLTPAFVATVSNIRVFKHSYDPATKKITLLWSYNNNVVPASGNDRIIDETFTKQ